MKNLDYLCMKTASEMVSGEGDKKDKENLATKGLGVLQENGPYGLILYLESNEKKKTALHYRDNLINLCREKSIDNFFQGNGECVMPDDNSFSKIVKWLRTVAEDLDHYLFLKQLWQECLTYVRYHAKALDEKPEPMDQVAP